MDKNKNKNNILKEEDSEFYINFHNYYVKEKKKKKEELKNIVNDENKFNKIEKKYLFELAQKYNYLFNNGT